MTHPKYKWRHYAVLPLLLIGLLAGSQLQNKYFKVSKNLEIFAGILKELEGHYVDEVDTDAIVKTGINAMLQSLDPYTNFFSEEDVANFRTFTTGEYGGIGAVIGAWKGKARIMMLYKDCPAHKAGVYVGDTIIRVNGEDMAAQPLDHISSLLKGMPSTQVQLTVVRQGVEQPITLTLTREKVNLKNVPYFGKVQDEIGYIRLANFATHAADEVQAALKSLQERGAQKLILDLRGNPGGILEEAIKVVNLFIDEGLTVVATKGKIASWAKTYTTTQSAYDSHLPVIVLIDQKSASAAEIVAGVIQDYDRGLLMGKSTFGKGLVQSTRSLSYNTQLKLTTARYYLPSGRSIQKIDYRQQKGTEQTVQEEQEVRSVFTTQAGRIVYEQEGVAPDIGGEKWRWAPITISLIEKGLVFEYATHFQAQNSHIAPASKFALSDAQYQDFVTWLQDKDYPYTIEQSINRLMTQAQEEAYTEDIKRQIELLKTQVQHCREKDLQRFKQEIKLALQEAIVARYYFQEGVIEALLSHDQNIQKACTFFQDMSQYYSLLKAAE